jgi:hypothetical protein
LIKYRVPIIKVAARKLRAIVVSRRKASPVFRAAEVFDLMALAIRWLTRMWMASGVMMDSYGKNARVIIGMPWGWQLPRERGFPDRRGVIGNVVFQNPGVLAR